MNKTTLRVPSEIRYLSEWVDFKLPEIPTIINKQLTGCGFTEWCLVNPNINVVLCSPRKILLENKISQHKGEFNIKYFNNTLEKSEGFERDMNSKSNKSTSDKILPENYTQEEKQTLLDLKRDISYHDAVYSRKNCSKILVTYDSFRHVKDALGYSINNYYIVIDEFQSIFIDSHFKSDTELEFVDQVKNLQKVCYVSATPMLENYLDFLDEFKDLPYIELDWETLNPSRVIRPQLTIVPSINIHKELENIITKYRTGNFDTAYRKNKDNTEDFITSKQAVIFVNSVKNICETITNNKLKPSEINILCAKTCENEKAIKKAFGLKSKEKLEYGIVPKKGEPHKMFTICTRTVYLGSDFYSTNAQTYIFSDANIDSLSVDISLDLPQILGRQRLTENPWKNRATFYYKTISKKNTIDLDEFKEMLNQKEKNTNDLLTSYESTPIEVRHALVEAYKDMAKTFNYKKNYISVNTHSSGDMIPVFNKLVMISEIRTYEIQQTSYRNRFTVFSTLSEDKKYQIIEDSITEKLIMFDSLTQFTDKMKLVCETGFDKETQKRFLSQVPIIFEKYYYSIGPEKIKALLYRGDYLKNEYNRILISELGSLKSDIISEFSVGSRYTSAFIKLRLSELYENNNYTGSAKATDLSKIFEIKKCLITNKDTGKREQGYEIVGLKTNQ